MGFAIRPYEDRDERGWLICRLLSFFDTAFFDAVEREKERYDKPSIELVAEKDGTIVGLLDLECESEGLAERPGVGGMIWHLATHPDHQTQGIASALLDEAERQAGKRGIVRLEAWTRDDAPTQRWYERHGFVQIDSVCAALDTILSTVLITDIVGSTERQATLGNRAWKGLVEDHHRIVREQLATWRGVENDTAGDGFFATFDGPARAIHCALEIRERLSALGLVIRAGLHTSECELIDGKHGGIAVAIGSRISSLAKPSQVLVSQTVKDLVAGSGLTFEDAGLHELNGVPGTWRVYAAS